MAFHPATRLDIPERILEHVFKRHYRSDQEGRVNQVEVILGPEPVFLAGIVDIEKDVLWHIDWLYWRQVCPDDFSIRENGCYGQELVG